MIRLFNKLFFTISLIALSSCFNSNTISNTKTVNNYEINDLSGKWIIKNSNDYIIFEDTTKKIVFKTSCGIITGDFTKINQALIFNHLIDYSSDCKVPQDIKDRLNGIAYYKVNSSKDLTLYDENHNEKLTLLYNK